MVNNNTKIIIERISQYANGAREIKIFIDGQLIGSIKNGETKEFIIKPGNREVLAKIDWCRTLPISFNIEQNMSARFELGSRLQGFRLSLAFFYALFDTKNFIYLEKK